VVSVQIAEDDVVLTYWTLTKQFILHDKRDNKKYIFKNMRDLIKSLEKKEKKS